MICSSLLLLLFLFTHIALCTGASVDGLVVRQLDKQRKSAEWQPLLKPSLLRPNARNFFALPAALSALTVTQLRLCNYPGRLARVSSFSDCPLVVRALGRWRHRAL